MTLPTGPPRPRAPANTPTSMASTSTTRPTGRAAADPAAWRARVGRDVRADPPPLAERHQVIAVDLQGHGRTADIDRPIDIRLMADDIAALIDHLGLEQPDVVGYSLGGGVALHTAAKYPDKVGRLVSARRNIRRDAIDPEMRAQQDRSARRRPTS